MYLPSKGLSNPLNKGQNKCFTKNGRMPVVHKGAENKFEGSLKKFVGNLCDPTPQLSN
jgi:hypothetical protein